MNQQIVQFLIEAKDKASVVVNEVWKNVDEMWKKTKSLSKDISSWAKSNEKSFQSMRNYGAIALGAISAFAIKALWDFADAQKSALALEHAVVWVTHWTQAQLKATSDLADELEKKWVLDWDNIKLWLAQLSTFWLSNTAVQKLWWSLADLAVNQFGASASGEQLSDTANMIAKALNGQFGVLEKSWIRFSESQKKMIEFGTEMQKVQAINEWFAQNLKYTNDVALQWLDGQMAKVKVQMGNLSESLWAALAPALNSLLQSVTPIIQKFTEWATKNPELLSKLVMVWWAIAWLVSVMWVLWLALPAIAAWFAALTWPIWLVIAGVALLATWVWLWINARKNHVQQEENVQNSYGNLKTAMEENRIKQEELQKARENWTITMWDYQWWMQKLKDQQDEIKWKLDNTTISFTDIREELNRLNNSKLSAEDKVSELMKMKNAADAATLAMQKTLLAAEALLKEQQQKQAKSNAVASGNKGSQIQWQWSTATMLDANILSSISTISNLKLQQWEARKTSDELSSALKRLWVWSTTSANEMKNLNDTTGNLSEKTKWAGKEVADYTKNMTKDFKEFSEKSIESIDKLKQNFDDDMSSLESKAKDIMWSLADINKQFSTDSQDLNKWIAEDIVAQEQKIADIKQEILDREAANKKSWLNNSKDEWLTALQNQLITEQAWYDATAQLRIDLETQIAEAKRVAWLTEIQRQLEQYQAEKIMQEQQYSEKYSRLQRELLDVRTQQTQITTLYNDSRQKIMDELKKWTDAYNANMALQAAVTKEKVDEMKTYYDELTKTIQKTIDTQSRLSSMWISSIWKHAHGWIIEPKRFASGGIATWPGGLDKVPAMLTAWEVVLNAAQQRNLAANLGNWWWQVININISGNEFNWSGEDFAEKIWDLIMWKFKTMAQFQSF